MYFFNKQGVLRVRGPEEIDDRASQPVGQHGLINKYDGQVITGNTVLANCGTRVARVSIDENHGPRGRDSGPLLLYRLLWPTYVAGNTTVFGRKMTPSGVVINRGPRPTDDWRQTYAGGFTKSITGLASNLGSSETYRPTSLSHSDPLVDPSDLSDLGNRAYGLLRPKIEKANLTQSLAEIGSAPRMLKTTLRPFHDLWKSLSGQKLKPSRAQNRNAWKQAPAELSDQFLNIAFGWSPALQDFLAVASTVQNISELVVAAEANNDRWQSRRFHEDIIESETVVSHVSGTSNNHCSPTLDSQNVVVAGSGSQTVTRRRVTRIWYEGSFKRYRPEFDGSLHKGNPSALTTAQQAATLLGLRVNPVTLYRCVPYTWLADYFGSVTSSLQRLEDLLTGEVVCRRFHLMRTVFDRYEYRVKFSTYDGKAHDITWVKEASVKRRVNAENEFGFSASPGGLTGMQSAVLAALGGSRTR